MNHTHAAAYRIVDVDLAGLVAFVRAGNHCPCDAVRHAGLVVYQCAGFDGPHQCRAYEVVREADGALVDLAEETNPAALCHARDMAQAFVLWQGGAAETDAELAAALTGAAGLDPMSARRLRFDPHPADYCPACL